MFDIADTDRLRIYVNVPQAYVNSHSDRSARPFLSRKRTTAIGRLPEYVARSAGVLDPATRTLLTELDFDNHDHLLWAGMYGEGHITVHRNHPMLTVPTAAMLFEANGTQLAVVDDQNHVHFKPVTVGQDLGQNLKSIGGLSSTDRVITNPGEKLLEGIEVPDRSARANPPNRLSPTPAIRNQQNGRSGRLRSFRQRIRRRDPVSLNRLPPTRLRVVIRVSFCS